MANGWGKVVKSRKVEQKLRKGSRRGIPFPAHMFLFYSKWQRRRRGRKRIKRKRIKRKKRIQLLCITRCAGVGGDDFNRIKRLEKTKSAESSECQTNVRRMSGECQANVRPVGQASTSTLQPAEKNKVTSAWKNTPKKRQKESKTKSQKRRQQQRRPRPK